MVEAAALGRGGIRLPSWLAALCRSKILYAVLILLIIALSFTTGSERQYFSLQNPKIDVMRMQVIDVDYHFLYPALEGKHSFLETFNWWHEPWRGDANMGGYWRPILMQFWWCESRLFGEDRSFNWMRVSILLTVAFDLLLVLFLWTFTRNRWLAALGLAIWALPPFIFQYVSPLSALPNIANNELLLAHGWKDQPDLFLNCLTLVAMILAYRNRYGWALLCAGIAIGFKEPGVMIFPLIVIFIALTQGIKKIPPWFYWGTIGILLVMTIFRWTAGPYVFYMRRYGRNEGAALRYMNAMLPAGLTAIYSYGQLLFGAAVFSVGVWGRKRLIASTLFLIAVFAASIGLVCWQEHLDLDVGFAQFLILGWQPILLLVLWLCSLAILYVQKQYFKWAIMLAICGYVAALPYASAAQATDHVLALGRSFLAGYGACVTFAVFTLAAQIIRRFAPHSHRSLPPYADVK